MITTVTGKNQITLPARLVRELGIDAGTQIDWHIGEDGVLIGRPLPSRGSRAAAIAGMGRAWLEPGADPVADLIRDRLADEPETT